MKTITDFLTAREGKAALDLGILAIIFASVFFQSLGRLPLIETDEARYMEIPREMLERGDFITPTLNYVKYFEKPPLHYWFNALSMQIFGETEFAARFFGALWGVAGILFIYHVGRKLFGRREGLLSAIILGSSIGVIIQSRMNITDTTLTICMTVCLGCFILAIQHNEQNKGLYYHLFYIFAALAVLAKGLIGLVLPAGIIFCHLLASRRWHLLREMRFATGIPLFLLICAPWFIAVSVKNPEFARFFFIHEHFERFLTKVHGRYQPPWFFVPVLIGVMLPWSFFLPTAFVRLWKERKQPGADTRLFLFVWAAFIFVFFSASSSKLIPYILPVYPALALLLGLTFSSLIEKGFSPVKVPTWFLSAICIFLGAGCMAYPHLARNPKVSAGGGAVLGVLLFAMGVTGIVGAIRSRIVTLIAGLAITALLAGIFAPPVVFARIAQRKSVRDLALIVREKADENSIIASFGYVQGLPFYAKRRVVVVGDRNELEFGSRQGDHSAWFVERHQFDQLWNGPAQVFTLINPKEIDSLRTTTHQQVTILGTSSRWALVTNR